MEKNIKNALNFYLLATSLKYKIRSGWDKTHWNVSSERIESIAEHIYGTCILAISIDSEFNMNVDLNKVIKMLVLHEIGEVVIGDITPFDNISPTEKLETEHAAIAKLVDNLVKKDEIISLLWEFDEHKTNESVFAYLCDKFEAVLQCKVYQDMGFQHSLTNQENNVVMKSNAIQKMIENGATDVFDVWYMYNKPLFKNHPVFDKFLDYINNNNLVVNYVKENINTK